MKAHLIIIIIFFTLLAEAQTFEQTYSFAEINNPYDIVEIKNGYLMAISSWDEANIFYTTSRIIKLNNDGTVKNKLVINENELNVVLKLVPVHDNSYMALSYRAASEDSNINILIYLLDSSLQVISEEVIPTIIPSSETILIGDYCTTNNNNIIYQLSYYNNLLDKKGYYFVEMDNQAQIINMNNEVGKNFSGTKACITQLNDSSYMFFDLGRIIYLNETLHFTDTFNFLNTEQNYWLMADVIWENDSSLIISTPYNSEQNFYQLGVSRSLYGSILVKDTIYSYNELFEMYAYYNSIDTVKGSIYLAGTSNFHATQTFSTDTTGIRILKLNKDFSINWDKTFKRDAFNFCTNIKSTSDGGCLITAQRYDFNADERVLSSYILKVDSLGNYQPNTIYETVATQKVSVYPNPGSKYLNIELENLQPNSIFQLYSYTGKLLLQQKINTNTKQISTYSLNPGMYFYKISSDNAVINTGKWVKQ